jgi:uncharacterized protein YprB with RNaseH-like and TPR domain
VDLRRRLALHRDTGAIAGTRAERIAALRARLEHHAACEPSRRRVEVWAPPPPAEPFNLPCAERQTRHGTLYIIDRRYDVEHRHGDVPVTPATLANRQAIAGLALDPALRDVDPARLLFLDTETTGLMGGTGTLAFLVGVGWFEDGAFRVEQLLCQPGREVPMLRRLADRLAEASGIATYNGKAFDWPLLRNRFVLNRVAVPPLAAHLDLLHCARRVLKYRLRSVRLIDVETDLLGFVREGDVEGGEIPKLYWRFLQSGDGAILGPILEHNAHDVVALAAILAKLASGFDGVGEADPYVRVGYAMVARRNHDTTRALAHARAAGHDLDARALAAVADLERHAGNFPAAVTALEGALAAGACGRQEALLHLALAKLWEHELKDLERALEHAQHTRRAEGRAEQEHRCARLRRRLARSRKR